jgi:hypothetical protein
LEQYVENIEDNLLQKRKAQRAPKTAKGRVFSYKLTTPGVSFAAALRGGAARQQPEALQVHAGAKLSTPATGDQQKAGQSVRAPTVSSQPVDNILRVVTFVQQIMTEFSGAVPEEEKTVAITKIVLNLMKQDGH